MKGIQPEDSINPPNVSDVFFGGDAPSLFEAPHPYFWASEFIGFLICEEIGILGKKGFWARFSIHLVS
jgi:hypothetical protein